jgi:hypothetical protein
VSILCSVVNIVTSLRAGLSEDRVPADATNFSLLQIFQTSSGVHPASYSMVTEVLSLGVDRPEHDVGH